MTGYGKGIAEGNERKVTIEMKAVNHRALDLIIKLPRGLAFCEDSIRKILSADLHRGHVEVYCNYEDNRLNKEKVTYDKELALKYQQVAKELEIMGFVNDMTVSHVLHMPDVLSTQSEDDDEDIILSLVKDATQKACDNLVAMRMHEGEMLYSDVDSRLNNLQAIVNSIKERAPLVSQFYSEKLHSRIEEILCDIEIDQARLYNEVAFFVDKSNIDEELARLVGHIEHGHNIMAQTGSVGESLDFLGQELMREANTTGSKSNDLELTRLVLDAKNEIKKIREQIQNIE
jgi:uncharacterized protein (TIGR00255 family)